MVSIYLMCTCECVLVPSYTHLLPPPALHQGAESYALCRKAAVFPFHSWISCIPTTWSLLQTSEQLLDFSEWLIFPYSPSPLQERASLLRGPQSLAPECLGCKAQVLSAFWDKLLYVYCVVKQGRSPALPSDSGPVPII